MECPKCHQTTNTNDIASKYFLGRNSDGIPFFKCEECGNVFYVNEKEGTAHSISRGAHGYRSVPITLGLLCWIISVGIVWFFDGNIVTWLIGGAFLLFGWSSIKIGIWGSQKLVDEMTLDIGVASSKEADQEWRKISKL